MQLVLLCGGLAKRMGPLTKDTPKSMLCINEKPFLEYQLELLQRSRITNVVLCVGHLCESIQDHFGNGSHFGLELKYSVEEDQLLGTGGALKKAQPLLEEEFLLMYGDSYLLLDYPGIMTRLRESDKLGLMVVYKNTDLYDSSNIVLEDNLVKVYDKRHRTKEMVYIDEGLSVLRKSALDSIPEAEVVPLEDLFHLLIRQRQLLAYETSQRFYEIGSLSGIKEFGELVRSGELST